MILTCTGHGSITLSDAVQIDGYYGYTPKAYQDETGLTGKVIRAESTKIKGQPLTVRGSQNTGWLTQTDLNTLQTWAALDNAVLTLQISDTETLHIQFRHENGKPFDVSPLFLTHKNASDYWVLNALYLQTIETP